MSQYNKITPEGTRDILFEECEARRRVEGTLEKLFLHRGFDEVRTPGLEFYDVFYSNAAYFPQESMYKLTDGRGRLLVMRPDCTIPIARLTCAKLGGLPRPLRLYYRQEVYRNRPELRGVSDEISQMGVELIGAPGEGADLEMLRLAGQCLEACGLEQYRLEICHIGFFKRLVAAAGLTWQQQEEARQLIESKNYAALGDLLEGCPDSPAARALGRLPRLFGGAEVLDEAEALLGAPAPELKTLRRLYDGLKAMGMGSRVMLDLGLVNQAEYYTGAIFRGYLEGVGEAVLSGGRYDGLMADFGEPAPATGFAVNVDLVAGAVMERSAAQRRPVELLIHGGPDCWTEALLAAEQAAEDGIRCEVSSFETEKEALEYARRRGVTTLKIVGPHTRQISVGTEGGRL